GGRPAQGESKIVYEASVAVIFLASYDAGMYRPQLIKALDWLQTVQKPHGGFGYLGRPTGDTSQVQYAVLAMWTLQQAGLEVPVSMVESTIRYLKSTLDPSGGWGYQGKVSSGGLIQQESVTKSLATAGIGALVIAGDILRFYGERKKKVDDEDGVPSAFVRTDLRQKVREERKGGTMRRGDIEGALALARRFQNTSDFSGTNWYYYWRYSQERYESFAEIMENQQQSSPTWYNRGVEHLAGLQAPNGSWGGPTSAGRDVTTVPVSTSFAVLFLVRSTQTAIGKLDEGVTFGGYGLPNDVTAVKLVGDRIVGDAETSVENLLLMLEADEAGDVQIGLLPEDLQLASDPAQRREQVARLARLLASGDYAARRIAAKLLGRSEDLARV
ncbi:MAG: hypothetical protein KDA45_17320, partial [Planctomycetales bacterium]|nr:hypothetical protein [Planctomycetales bacterium]